MKYIYVYLWMDTYIIRKKKHFPNFRTSDFPFLHLIVLKQFLKSAH